MFLQNRHSSQENAILKYVGLVATADPCRLKFNMADVSRHLMALYHNIFRVYTRISHDIFILMFCSSLQHCKISVGCSC